MPTRFLYCVNVSICGDAPVAEAGCILLDGAHILVADVTAQPLLDEISHLISAPMSLQHLHCKQPPGSWCSERECALMRAPVQQTGG